MRCPEINDMAAFLDETLSPARQCHWMDHFSRCEMCRLALAELRELLGRTPHDDPSGSAKKSSLGGVCAASHGLPPKGGTACDTCIDLTTAS